MIFIVGVLIFVVAVVVIALHLFVWFYLRRLAWLKRSNICVKAPLLPIAMVTGEIAKYFNRRPESEVSSYDAYNNLWFKDFATDRHHVWVRVASTSPIDDVLELSLKAIQKWSTQRGKIAIHASMRRLHFGITIAHAVGEVTPSMEDALYDALNAFDPGHLYRSLSFRHPFRSANILSKRYTQQAYHQLQKLLATYLKLTATTTPSTSPSTPKSSPLKRSPVLTSLLEYHGDRESSSQVAEEKAIADIIAYLLGAISNVSSVLAWMIYDFSHHPEWRLSALKEAQTLFPQGVRQLGDRDRLRQAKVLRKCIQESIRLRDRFTTGIRRLTCDVTVPLPKSAAASSTASALPSQPDSPSSSGLSSSSTLSSHSVTPPETCSTTTSGMTFQKGSYVILPYYYDGIDDTSYNPDRQLPRTHFSMFGSGTHTCRGRDYALAQITAMIAWLLLTDAERRTASDVTTSTSSSCSSPFRWCGIGPWVSSVPCSMASFTGVNSPPDDAPLYVEM